MGASRRPRPVELGSGLDLQSCCSVGAGEAENRAAGGVQQANWTSGGDEQPPQALVAAAVGVVAEMDGVPARLKVVFVFGQQLEKFA